MRNVKHYHVEKISNAEREDHIQQGEQCYQSRSQVEAHDDEDPGHPHNEQRHLSEKEMTEDVESVGGVHRSDFHHASLQVCRVDLIQVELGVGRFDGVPVIPEMKM